MSDDIFNEYASVDEELVTSAIHEAGHFVMMAILGGLPSHVSISATERSVVGSGLNAYPLHISAAPFPAIVMCDAVTLWAGAVACDVYGRDFDHTGFCGDEGNSDAEKLWEIVDDHGFYIAESIVYRLMGFRRVQAAVLDVARWLLEVRSADEDQTGEKYIEVHRRIGFLRSRVDRWIDEALNDSSQ